MAEAKRREAWEHTSNLLAMLINVNRTKEIPVANAADWNPFSAKNLAATTKNPGSVVKISMAQLRDVFVNAGIVPGDGAATETRLPLGLAN